MVADVGDHRLAQDPDHPADIEAQLPAGDAAVDAQAELRFRLGGPAVQQGLKKIGLLAFAGASCPHRNSEVAGPQGQHRTGRHLNPVAKRVERPLAAAPLAATDLGDITEGDQAMVVGAPVAEDVVIAVHPGEQQDLVEGQVGGGCARLGGFAPCRRSRGRSSGEVLDGGDAGLEAAVVASGSLGDPDVGHEAGEGEIAGASRKAVSPGPICGDLGSPPDQQGASAQVQVVAPGRRVDLAVDVDAPDLVLPG